MASNDFERVLCVKQEVFVFRIPPRPSNRGYRAADWKLDAPDWTGRLRVVAKGKDITLKMEDKISGELFAQCPVDAYPGLAVEQVMDSSRYFVLKIQDDSGRSAFIGIGFQDRADSFDLCVTMQDHFKVVKREEQEKVEAAKPFDAGPKLDLSFKEGQTIKININTKKSGSEQTVSKPRPKPSAGGTPGLLPPPPGGLKIAGPPRSARTSAAAQSGSAVPPVTLASNSASSAPSSATNSNDLDFLLDLGGSSSTPQNNAAQSQAFQQISSQPAKPVDPWGDFTG